MKTKDLNKNVTNKLHMKHKYYNFKIVLELLKKESHLRGLSTTLGTNPMMISRKLEELSIQNVVDYKLQGKNKVYFLKKTLESKTFVFMAEKYRLLIFLEKYPSFRRIIELIQQNKNFHLAVLFGSYAKNLANSRSDVDIYIETTDVKIKHEIEKIDSSISVKIGKYDRENLLIKEIEKSHVILKGVEEYYEKNEFFI